jgi:hypothetical protein
MTKISKKQAYPIKKPVVRDYFVGTDSENNDKTVSFDFESTAQLINGLNGFAVSNYLFKTSYNIDLDVLTEGVFLSKDNATDISSITKLYINKKNHSEVDISELFQFISVNREVFLLKLRNANKLTNSVYFNITNATEFQDYFTFDVLIYLSNSSLETLEPYQIYFFDFELKSSDLAINLPEFNKIVSETGFTVLSNVVTINPSWVWLIKNVYYTNSLAVDIPIPLASTGKKRIDLIALNAFNTIIRIEGEESVGNPIKPNLLPDTLEATFCLVDDTEIGEIPPVDLSEYARIDYVDYKDSLKVDKLSGYSLTKNDLTDLLKSAYDNVVNWVSTNGANLIAHLLRTDNPHSVTASQVGAPSGSGTSNGVNTGDNSVNTTSNAYADAKVADAITDGVTTIAPSQNAVFDGLQKKLNLPTGFVSGLQLSINANPSLGNIAAGIYTITDFSDLANPTVLIKTFAGLNGVSPTYLASANATYIALDLNGNVIQSASPFTNEDRRTLAILGSFVHSNHTSINVTNEIKAPIVASTNQLHDFMEAIGFLNKEGNIYTANGANLQINKSVGKIFGMGINAANYLNPHELTIPAQTAITFAYRLRGGTQFADTQNIDPNNWDNNNVLTATGGGNKWQIQHINLFQSGICRIQYGQQIYTSFNNAVSGLPTDPFITEANIADRAVFRSYLIIKQGITNLTTAITNGDVLFVPVDKFGNVIGNGAVALTFTNIIAALGYTPENLANKTDIVAGNETNTTLYSSIKGIVDYFTSIKIKSILGITTLSGSNTGDETTASLKTKIEEEWAYACSDELSDLAIGDVISFRAPFAMTLSEVRISLNSAPTVSSLVVDVKESGVSIFSTRPSIDPTELTSVTAAIAPVISDANLTDDALLTVSITQVGSGAAGKGLKILFKGKKT